MNVPGQCGFAFAVGSQTCGRGVVGSGVGNGVPGCMFTMLNLPTGDGGVLCASTLKDVRPPAMATAPSPATSYLVIRIFGASESW